MPEKSFWENLGRGIGYGIRKAKEVGAHLSDQAEGRLDVRQARERLERAHVELGRLVSGLASEEGRRSVDLEAQDVRDLLEKVRSAEEELAAIEASLQAKKEAPREDEERPPAESS